MSSVPLQPFEDALADLSQKRTTVAQFCLSCRAQSGLLSSLPERYAAVMEDLLTRMETGSLFGEESCSFSQEDLQAHFATWLEKTRQALTRG